MRRHARLDTTPPYVRLDELLRPAAYEPPACNVPTAAGWCVLPENHRDTHIAFPPTYDPQDVNQ